MLRAGWVPLLSQQKPQSEKGAGIPSSPHVYSQTYVSHSDVYFATLVPFEKLLLQPEWTAIRNNTLGHSTTASTPSTQATEGQIHTLPQCDSETSLMLGKAMKGTSQILFSLEYQCIKHTLLVPPDTLYPPTHSYIWLLILPLLGSPRKSHIFCLGAVGTTSISKWLKNFCSVSKSVPPASEVASSISTTVYNGRDWNHPGSFQTPSPRGSNSMDPG